MKSLVSLELDLTDSEVIKNPSLLNNWCAANSTKKTQHDMSAKAINHFKGRIPENKMYKIILPKYKDDYQRNNAMKRIAVKSIDTEILEISKTLTVSKKKKLLNYIRAEFINCVISGALSR